MPSGADDHGACAEVDLGLVAGLALDAAEGQLVCRLDAADEPTDKPVEHARHLTGVAPALRGLLLELIDLLDHEDRDDDLVVGEGEDGARIVNENVRVENEVFHWNRGTSGATRPLVPRTPARSGWQSHPSLAVGCLVSM